MSTRIGPTVLRPEVVPDQESTPSSGTGTAGYHICTGLRTPPGSRSPIGRRPVATSDEAPRCGGVR